MHETEQPPSFSAWALALALINAGEPELAYAALAEIRPELNDPTQAESVRDRVEAEPGEFGDAEIVTAAHALDLAGRRDEARGLWQAALAAAEREPPRTWLEYLNLSLLHGRIGNTAAAIREFKAAYDAGFRYLWSYDCDGCVHDGFYAGNGQFAGLVEIPEIAALVDKIEAENAQTLEALNEQYGVLDKVRAMMAAEPEQ
jgi:tetratricopeptide (TPR) repeat protein